MRLRGALAAVLLAALALPARPAAAYPQFQFSSGTTRCSQCHFAPAGGGLLSSWGRGESADTIARWGGSGDFAHGLVKLPGWMALGADVRVAGDANDVQEEKPQVAVFPMQADVYARVQKGAWSLYGVGGMRAVARTSEGGSSVIPGADQWLSREHFVMWQPEALGVYVRAGRFFAPYGLRLAEHVSEVRRRLGFNLFEETMGVSGGVIREDWELHATAFVPALYEQYGVRETGGAATFERRLGGIASLGAQARVGHASDESRFMGGLTGKVWLERARLLLMGEADLVHQTFAAAGLPSRRQIAGHLGATFIPVRGLMVGVAGEEFDENLAESGVARTSVSAQIQFFPWAHVELSLLGRRQMLGSGEGDGAPASLGLLQVHYWL